MVDSTVRAMTWNIWWRFGPRWRDRQPGIEATITRFSPDVVALQEVWSSEEMTQADELAKSLDMYAVFASPSYPPAPTGTDVPDFAGVDLGIAVLSRWPILDQDTAVMPARHRSWDPVSLAVRVDHPTGPLPIVATCLDYGVPYTDDRIAQARFVAALATAPPLRRSVPSFADGRHERSRQLASVAISGGCLGRRVDGRQWCHRRSHPSLQPSLGAARGRTGNGGPAYRPHFLPSRARGSARARRGRISRRRPSRGRISLRPPSSCRGSTVAWLTRHSLTLRT
jgi:hypothetical protein